MTLAKSVLTLSVGQYSSAGRKSENQDFHGALLPEDQALRLKGAAFTVADGISSSAVGRIAAETAVKSFLSDYYCTSDTWTVKTAASRVISASNSWLHAQHRPGYSPDRGHVCTFDALILKGHRAHLFHVGDGRIWRLSGDSLEQLTEDHRVRISADENYLGRALGLARSVDIDYRDCALRHGDMFVLTTDGVHEFVRPKEIADHIAKADDLDAAARSIITAALEAGSDDNLTIQIVRVDTLPPADAEAILQNEETLAPAPVLTVPCDFEGYRVLRQIHASHRSHIYLAQDLDSGEKVALKVPSLDLRGDEAYLRRFAMEEWIARRLNSPHVLKAAPRERERQTLFAVTEYVEGQTLRQWMIDHPAPGFGNGPRHCRSDHSRHQGLSPQGNGASGPTTREHHGRHGGYREDHRLWRRAHRRRDRSQAGSRRRRYPRHPSIYGARGFSRLPGHDVERSVRSRRHRL